MFLAKRAETYALPCLQAKCKAVPLAVTKSSFNPSHFNNKWKISRLFLLIANNNGFHPSFVVLLISAPLLIYFKEMC